MTCSDMHDIDLCIVTLKVKVRTECCVRLWKDIKQWYTDIPPLLASWNLRLPATMASTAPEFCAFTVAIALECYPWSTFDCRTQLSPSMLTLGITAGPRGDNVNFYVTPEAWHEGLFIFKKTLRKFNHDLIVMAGKKGVMQTSSFTELPGRSKQLVIPL